MTAPDQPAEHAASLLPASPTAGSSDLRDQLDGAICDADFDDVIAVAKKAITEVERQAAEIKRLRSRERIANQHARRTDAERAEADARTARAEARTARAEARYAELDAMHLRSVADLTKRAEDAEAERRDWQMAAQTAENELARLRTHQQTGDQP